ncbi:MAG TPA: NFACT RNA binding domain-containing protein [archaeon]|nr:NFACT RNA binding domain-containing protein [archaeon]
MRVEIDFTKSVEQNANSYYDLAKKSKKKLEGLAKGQILLERKIAAKSVHKATKKLVKKKERKWFEKFHWGYTSNGHLVVAGRDARGNETIVKKIMQPGDIYFHADINGAAHTVLKAEGAQVLEKEKKEAAIFAAVFSKAWNSQVPAIDVYSASPDQVTKKAPSGESLGTGAFMVYGQRVWYKKTPLEFALGFCKKDASYELFSGPQESIQARSDVFFVLKFGSSSKGDAAKRILRSLEAKFPGLELNLDDIVALLPNGGIEVQQ